MSMLEILAISKMKFNQGDNQIGDEAAINLVGELKNLKALLITNAALSDGCKQRLLEFKEIKVVL